MPLILEGEDQMAKEQEVSGVKSGMKKKLFYKRFLFNAGCEIRKESLFCWRAPGGTADVTGFPFKFLRQYVPSSFYLYFTWYVRLLFSERTGVRQRNTFIFPLYKFCKD